MATINQGSNLPSSSEGSDHIDASDPQIFCLREISEVAQTFRTDIENGLSAQEAQTRLGIYGRNELPKEEHESLIRKFLEKFKEPLILLLLASGAISLLMGQLADAAGILVAISIVNGVGFYQEYRSARSVSALKSLTTTACVVQRDGRAHEVPAAELVPGDVVLLHAGQRVPADARLAAAQALELNEAVLTGESEAALKSAAALSPAALLEPHVSRANLVYCGTAVTAGHARAIVLATGERTSLGRISRLIRQMEDAKTPLQQKMDEIGKQLSVLAIAIVAGIFLLGALQGKPLLAMFTVGVSLAVAAIPEGLPIVVTVTLALGVTRMAARAAIVRRLPAVEALGATAVICSDKTGTMTQNQMTVQRLFAGQLVDVHGSGYQVRAADHLRAAGAEHPLDAAGDARLAELLRAAGLCCNAQLRPESGQLVGSPTEGALLALLARARVRDPRETHVRLDELPFDHERKWMAVRCVPRGLEAALPRYYVKGAPENVLALCSSVLNPAGQPVKLHAEKLAEVQQVCDMFGDSALRLLAVASGERLEDLTLLGVLGIGDRPRPGVQHAVAETRAAGIQVVMVTGDSQATAVAIARELGFFPPEAVALSGAQLDAMPELELLALLPRLAVLYRMSPQDKLKIINAFKRGGFVTAMTGDGVNDAAALKCADIGVAMGQRGTDVAAEAADIILVDDNFATIVAAIEEGKAVYANIRNFVRYQLTTSIATLGLVACSTLFGMPLPFTPTQILWINIIMDGPPAQSLGVEPADPALMRKPPRDPKQSIFSRPLVLAIVLNALVMVVGTLHIYGAELRHTDEGGSDSTRASTVAFTTFVFFQMLNAFNCRSEDKSAFSIPLSRNRFFVWAVLGSVLLQLLALYFPPLQYLFDTVPLSAHDLLRAAGYAVAVLCSDELRKWLVRRFASGSRAPPTAGGLSLDLESLTLNTPSKQRGE